VAQAVEQTGDSSGDADNRQNGGALVRAGRKVVLLGDTCESTAILGELTARVGACAEPLAADEI
jgi:hypothetical protein